MSSQSLPKNIYIVAELEDMINQVSCALHIPCSLSILSLSKVKFTYMMGMIECNEHTFQNIPEELGENLFFVTCADF